MLEAFSAADLLKRVEQLSSQMVDLRAKAIVEDHLDPSKPEQPSRALKEAIEKASASARGDIFESAKEARSGERATNDTKSRAIPVLRALIESDTRDLEHEYHGELGHVLRNLGDPQESKTEWNR